MLGKEQKISDPSLYDIYRPLDGKPGQSMGLISYTWNSFSVGQQVFCQTCLEENLELGLVKKVRSVVMSGGKWRPLGVLPGFSVV
ncbi:hypothetical protein AOY38_08780 [Synechocystis sp. PCC 6803]|nr:hypothetical protein AOY38_08780 [Synechocystis sp. PCC 6803]AVP89755.1 hypothetical protein C7I86_08790 [Synechocystis sp. IPPAS B-1465]QHV00195.1 hypothetical protein BWK47_08665 [Synechocystis sp. CACIAM 05]